MDDALWDILDGLLSKDPAQRPTAREAASTLRRLVPRLAGGAPIARGEAPADFDDVARPATVVRGAFTDAELTAFASALPVDVDVQAPELGEAGSATIARPIPRREVRPQVEDRLDETDTTPFWRTRKALLLAGTAALLLVAMVVGFMLLAPINQQTAPATAGQQLSTQLQDSAPPDRLNDLSERHVRTVLRSDPLDCYVRGAEGAVVR